MTARSLIKGSPPEHLFSDWEMMRRYLHVPTESTRFVYTHPSNNLWWDLAGRNKGRQGVRLAKEVQGMYHLPFTQLFTEGAYQVGSTYERTNIDKRVANIGVTIGYNTSDYAYRMIESNWWDSWPEDSPGWWGCHSPTGGWRWSQVMLAKTVDTSMPTDPTSFGNNGFTWDMSIVFPKPTWNKRSLTETWTAHPATTNLLSFDETTFHIANRGNLPVWPKFVFSGPGQCYIQDGMLPRMVKMPVLQASDGYVLVDTDPSQRTFTAATDPIDNIFYQFIRASTILDFFLHDIEALGLPVWRRGRGIRFTSPIPPKTVAHIKVKHNHPGATVTCIIPQRFSRPS